MIKIRHRFFNWSIIFLVILLLTGCSKTTLKEDNRLKIGLMPDIGMYPLLVAEEAGFFKDEGLDVEIVVFKSASDRDAALQGGQLNGAMSDLLAVYFMANNGINVKATSLTESRFLLLGGKDQKITDLDDLQNVPIGLSLNTVIEYFVDRIMESRGIVAEKMSVPKVPVRMELLRNGQLKAASLPDPLATVLFKTGAVVLADSREEGIDPAVLLFTENTTQKQKKALKNFYKAYNRAVEVINKDPEKYKTLLFTKGDFPESVINDIEIPTFRKAGLPDHKEVQAILHWAEKKGLKKVDLNYDDLVVEGICP